MRSKAELSKVGKDPKGLPGPGRPRIGPLYPGLGPLKRYTDMRRTPSRGL